LIILLIDYNQLRVAAVVVSRALLILWWLIFLMHYVWCCWLV